MESPVGPVQNLVVKPRRRVFPRNTRLHFHVFPHALRSSSTTGFSHDVLKTGGATTDGCPPGTAQQQTFTATKSLPAPLHLIAVADLHGDRVRALRRRWQRTRGGHPASRSSVRRESDWTERYEVKGELRPAETRTAASSLDGSTRNLEALRKTSDRPRGRSQESVHSGGAL
jgi:hypothetical protein